MDSYCDYLEWDSNFFGFKIFQLKKPLSCRNDLLVLSNFIKKNDVGLIYYCSNQKIKKSPIWVSNIHIKYLVERIFYTKIIGSDQIESQFSFPEFEEVLPDENLFNIAIQAGKFSRFNLDDKIPKDKFEELYRLWVTNSLKNKKEEKVIVYRSNNKIIGLITLKKINRSGTIGLIAVDSNYRGKGIGKVLMNFAERWFAENGCNKITVITQRENEPACKLYEYFEFKIEKQEFFYHIWKK